MGQILTFLFYNMCTAEILAVVFTHSELNVR